jgi:glyoxylase-like metal-dependent hydrolase (beta-lactamase superfamily II)
VIYWFTVGRLSCAVISDGQMTPPWEPPLAAFFTPATGVPDHELRAALAGEGRHKTTVSCGYNCVLVQTSGHAVIDTGLGARFLGYGPPIEPLVGRLGDGLASAGAPAAQLAAVVFTHLHQDHCRGATWSGELTFPGATGFAHAAEVAFWSGAEATRVAAGEHLASAREAIRLSATGCARSTMTPRSSPASAWSTRPVTPQGTPRSSWKAMAGGCSASATSSTISCS